MSDQSVVVERGLPEDLRDQAVEIFEDAFGDKMRMAVRDPLKRREFMRRSFVADHAIVARRGERLLGMAGLSSRDEPFSGGLMGRPWDPRPYRDVLGWLGAAWAVWGLRLADHTPRADELYVDGIAVAAASRGLGIGTLLLGEVRAIAREHGKRWVRLDVVDTNPRAQALYERLGYRVTRVQSLALARRWTGFGAMISMEQPVDLGSG